MAKKQLPDPLEIQRAEAAGFIFSDDKKILLSGRTPEELFQKFQQQ